MKLPIAITTSDWHLRTTVPGSRAEPSWFPVMKAQIDQLRELSQTLNPEGPIPLLVAGDVFDRCDPPSSIVTWAIEALQGLEIYAIPGQHDLLGHRYEERFTGAYGALCKAGVIRDVEAGKWHVVEVHSKSFALYGAPWERYGLTSMNIKYLGPSVALIHKYLYINDETKYVGASETGHVRSLTEYMQNFDVVACGDNHIAWKVANVINHGSLFQLTSAQTTHRPRIGIVYSDGSLDTRYLDEYDPKWHESVAKAETSEGIREFVADLKSIQTDSVQFMELLDAGKDKLNETARAIYGELRDAIKAG